MTLDYFICGQKLSGSGMVLVNQVEVLKTENMALRPLVMYNPNKNQYLLIYCLGEDNLNIRGVILAAQGKAVGKHFKVTDVPANQVHYTMAFNNRRNQFFVTYNDDRNGANDVFGLILENSGRVVKEEFAVSSAEGHQISPVVCYNPKDDTYLVNWEDFRVHGDERADG